MTHNTSNQCPPASDNTITLIKQDGSWCAQYGGPHAERIRDLFGGSDTIATPYHAGVAGNWLLSKIQALNPGVLVQLA